ncbi:hypothetical protein B0T21DRAFT_32923 [Apiosordaria backusii]|uniref:Uncharacterized protein n=1 Tax=Apiosordaria backusii TaxID=314023 RepID=A0AA40B2G4_9PEZI|nr:hypothetical protein B0T21DRAFT_32923 [Apiosordaria backusii]
MCRDVDLEMSPPGHSDPKKGVWCVVCALYYLIQGLLYVQYKPALDNLGRERGVFFWRGSLLCTFLGVGCSLK